MRSSGFSHHLQLSLEQQVLTSATSKILLGPVIQLQLKHTEIHFGGTECSLPFLTELSAAFTMYLVPAEQGLQTSQGQTLLLLPTQRRELPAAPQHNTASEHSSPPLSQARRTATLK